MARSSGGGSRLGGSRSSSSLSSRSRSGSGLSMRPIRRLILDLINSSKIHVKVKQYISAVMNV